jgi:chromosome partitioning protein
MFTLAPGVPLVFMQVISIANQKGGVGKSTLSCLLAFYLADREKARVAAIDLDNQRNLSLTLRQFGVEVPTTSFFEDTPLNLPKVRKQITLFHGTPQLANLERANAAEANRRVQTFAAHIEAIKEEFDYCLLDPPPTLGVRMVAALASTDFVAMPIELEEYSTQAVTDMLKTVFGIREQWNPKLKFLGILANRFMHNSVRQKAALRELFDNYKEYVLPIKISTRAAIPRALEEGYGVWQLPGASGKDASAEVLQAFDVIMTRIKTAQTTGNVAEDSRVEV